MSVEVNNYEPEQYKSIDKAEGYKTFFDKSLLQFELIDKPSIKRLIGNDLRGKSVIDFACGNGGTTRFLADLGPSKLIGVDLSQTMIDLAIRDYKSNPTYSFVDFYVRDCSEPVDLGQFDLVFSRHLLNYARTKEILRSMIKAMFESTKPGGVCVGFMPDPHTVQELDDFSKFFKYNVEWSKVDEVESYVRMYEGEARKSAFLRDLHVWFWPPKLYEDFFNEVGFQGFEWIDLRLESDEKQYKDHFKDFFDPCIYTLFKATRPF